MKRLISPEEMQRLVGQQVGTSEWLAVTQDRIDKFAEATGDFQFIHVDPERAAHTPFSGTVAHGFLTLSLIPMLMETSDCPRLANVRMGVNYGGNKTRFLAPVRAGKRVRGVFTLLDFSQIVPGQWQHTMENVIEIEGEPKPALICEWIARFHL